MGCQRLKAETDVDVSPSARFRSAINTSSALKDEAAVDEGWSGIDQLTATFEEN